jgi:hypothetical protein
MPTFVKQSRIEAPRAEVFAWHAHPAAFARLTPPWERVRIVADSGGIEDGACRVLAIGWLGLRWVARHEGYRAGEQFRDVQERGPFRRWTHTHTFRDAGPGASILEDRIDYELPLGAFGELLVGWLVRRKLARLFAWRHRATAEALDATRDAGGRTVESPRPDSAPRSAL